MIVAHNAKGIGPLVAKCFKTRKPITVELFRGPKNVNSYWDSGSKDEYRLANLVTGEIWQMPTSHPLFNRKPNGERCGSLELNELPENCALVHGGYYRGKRVAVTVYLRQENLTPLIEAPQEQLSEKALRALSVIDSTKGGPYRREEFQRSGLGLYDAENPHIKELEALEMVKINKRGAVSTTLKGKQRRANDPQRYSY